MRTSSPVVLVLACALAAPLAAAAENLAIQPGKWQIRTEIENSMMPEPRVETRTECVTDEEWDAERLMSQAQGCSFSDVEASAGRLSWDVECTGPGGRMTGRAVYVSEGDSVDGKMDMAMQSGQTSVTMAMKFDGRRIGECD